MSWRQKVRSFSSKKPQGRFSKKAKEDRQIEDDAMDAQFGFAIYRGAAPRLGWLVNIRSSSEEDSDSGLSHSSVDLYFVEKDGSTFKCRFRFLPYFYVKVTDGYERDAERFLRGKFETQLASLDLVELEDLDMENHLSGKKAVYLKISARNVSDLMEIRGFLMPIIEENRKRTAREEIYSLTSAMTSSDAANFFTSASSDPFSTSSHQSARPTPGRKTAAMMAQELSYFVDIREYDIKYHVRVCIDMGFRVGFWYYVSYQNERCEVQREKNLEQRAEPVICAFDIETTKQPLKFPDPAFDEVMMISYMLDQQGFLLINRSVVSKDIEDFEYTPKEEYEGNFIVVNLDDEKSLLQYWIDHMRRSKPIIYVTFNGDAFDWPFIDKRAHHHGISLFSTLGVRSDETQYHLRYGIHMDAFAWVRRDSYLPQGSQGLKAVTKAKLGYDPLELDPEEMTPLAVQDPWRLASYSVSDAVATYYLYMKYVHPFIFSLCTIIPMPPDEVLRKGSGTLCETLLMVEAFNGKIVCPNRHSMDSLLYTSGGRLLESETYVGGHVECLQAGVFRNDLPVKFELDTTAFDYLIDHIDDALKFSITKEGGLSLEEITNYTEVRDDIVDKLQALRSAPKRKETPLIYHLDVSAMYPNIILTNRLQPCSIVDDTDCAACVHNRPSSDCKRSMQWIWRGELFKASRHELDHVRAQLRSETFKPQDHSAADRAGKKETMDVEKSVTYDSLSPDRQASELKKRLAAYCRKVYRKVHETVHETRTSTVCQRENPFYVNTVLLFRDRRYEYKRKHKMWQKNLSDSKEAAEPSELRVKECKDMVVLYDSLQIAHKCILNSFYGYVMRKGARWYSMHMAGIVTNCGAKIITMARELVERIGVPLELDTDGIWCALPASFPENFTFKTSNPGRPKYTISYPCVMLNADVHSQFTNPQYQELIDRELQRYQKRSECTIFFEVDGPYRAMILPASKEEGKHIKKRYAVFHDDGTLAELKGFEVKRRGELKMIKVFQSEVFSCFLRGDTLEACYDAVADVANRWVDLIVTKGKDVEDDFLLEHITESTTMKRRISEYEGQKSAAITTARRLAELLGADVVKDPGLACDFIVSKKPEGKQVTERTIPVTIFASEKETLLRYLRKWTDDPSLQTCDIRDILDWDYYLQRLGSAIQKIITIPAAFQNVKNPVPRVPHPDWMIKKSSRERDMRKQRRLDSMFVKNPIPSLPCGARSDDIPDIEDIGTGRSSGDMQVELYDKEKQRQEKEAEKEKEEERKRGRELEKEFSAFFDGSEIDGKMRESLGREFYRHEGFPDWLRMKKVQWREMREARQKRRKLLGDLLPLTTSGGFGAPTSGRAGMFSSFYSSMAKHPWKIVSIVEDPDYSVGKKLHKMWVLVGNTLTWVHLHIPRVFYVNSLEVNDVAQDGIECTQVSKFLPHARKSEYLYEYRMEEDKFDMIRGTLAAFLNDPNIEGVYETQVSLVFSAVLKMGNVIGLRESAKAKMIAGGKTYELDDFVSLSVAPENDPIALSSFRPKPYIQKNDFKEMFLVYSITDERPARAVFALIDERLLDDEKRADDEESASKESFHGVVVIVQPHESAPKPRIRFDNVWKDVITANGADIRAFPSVKNTDLRAQYVSSVKEAYSALQKHLEAYHKGNHGPSFVIQEGPFSSHHLQSEVRGFQELPMFEVDSMAARFEFPALDWVRPAVRNVAERLLHVHDWVDERLPLASYAAIPLGNMGKDMALNAMDIMFGRSLRREMHVLWASETGTPDFGGLDEEQTLFSEEQENPVICVSGGHIQPCVSLEVAHLDIASILESVRILSEEGAGFHGDISTDVSDSVDANMGNDVMDAENGDKKPGPRLRRLHHSNATIGGKNACLQVFRVLRSLIEGWYNDVVREGNVNADLLMQNFHRWLRSPYSRLHDPALFQFVHGLMKKLFTRLCITFKKFGASIVFASFDRILLTSAHPTVADARTHVSFVLNHIRKDSLFGILDIRELVYWKYLAFVDMENYGGIREGEMNEIISHWNMAEYLDVRLQDVFLECVATFVQRRLDVHDEVQGEEVFGESQQQAPSQDRTIEGRKTREEIEKTRFHEILERDVFPHILNITERMNRVLSSSDAKSADLLAARPSTIDTKNQHPALEFVKSLCHIFSLDRMAESVVRSLKRSAMRILGVREFSKEDTFRNPCQAFILPDVFCPSCCQTRDLDLCRDAKLTPEKWRCVCGEPYNKEQLETHLVDMVHRRFTSYQVQDLVHDGRRDVKDDHMGDVMDYRCKIPAERFIQFLGLVRQIARYHNLSWLEETTLSLLGV